MHKKWLPVLGMILFVFCSSPVPAKVSVNVPLGHWSYDDIDKLISLGLIRSALWGTRPFTRLEMARLILEARTRFKEMAAGKGGPGGSGRAEIAGALLNRLDREFRTDLDELEPGKGVSTYIKPLEDVYVHYLYGNHDFDIENDKGQTYSKGSNLRTGFSTHGVLFGHFGYYLNPEFRYSQDAFGGDDQELTLLEGYGKVEWFNVELEAGRDSLWWGPGRHGNLILTDNAKPFDLIKLSNPRPVLLPWIFRHLGLFKFVAFWTQLEDDRAVPDAQLMGLRLDIKPFPFLDIGGSRTLMLGGKGGAKGVSELGPGDWWTIMTGENIRGSLDTNQIAGLDFDLRVPGLDRWVSFLRSIDLWGEWYGEDQANYLPSKPGYVAGVKFEDILLTGKTDLVLEYAENVISGRPDLWYNHHIYRTGYRYEGEVMGHNMGTDARDYFLRVDHYLSPNLILDVGYNLQQRHVESQVQEDRDRFDLGVTWHRSESLLLNAGYRFEAIQNLDQIKDKDRDNHILSLFVNYSF
jgi:hypothetical protein